MRVVIWDVEHGACAMIQHVTQTLQGEVGGRLAMIDSGSAIDWTPSFYLRNRLRRTTVDYLFITNADQDHMSDLKGLEDAGIGIRVLSRNPTYTGNQLRAIKMLGGPLSQDAAWYADACDTFDQPATEPFNQYMNGITVKCFWNSYPLFTDTNNLSQVVFVKYCGFCILFPGDLEKDGWRALLRRPDFQMELIGVNVLVAPHHGRENGFCPEVFDYCQPQCIVVSDKPIQHQTQQTVPDYRNVIARNGVIVRTTGKIRHVLTTRRDGTISFDVLDNGNFAIDTEYAG